MDPCASVEQTESTRLFRSECVCIDEWMVHYGKQHDPDLQSAAVQPETGSLNSDKSPKHVGEKSKIYRCKSCINLNDSLVRLHPPIQKWINAWIILTKHNSRRLMLTFSVHVLRGCHKCAAWKVLQDKRLWIWPLNTLNWNYCERHSENNWLIKNSCSENPKLQRAGDPQYTKVVIINQRDASFSSNECSQQIITFLFQFNLFGLTVFSQCNWGGKSSIQSWKVCRQQPREPINDFGSRNHCSSQIKWSNNHFLIFGSYL